jgi:RNA 2',3'-cyclic 3'-phosphodiesterase
MRCFLAIELSKEAREEIVKIQQEIKKYVKGKFVEPENLHLTLEFFGELNDEQVNKIKQILKELKFEKFQASLGKIGFFPNDDFIRVIWVSLESDKIKELHNKIKGLLNIKEDKFESHITIARIKNIKNKEEYIKKVKEISIKPIEFKVSSFSFKKSTLTEKGPIYENIVKFESS